MAVGPPATRHLLAATGFTIAGRVDTGAARSRNFEADIVRSVNSGPIDESNSRHPTISRTRINRKLDGTWHRRPGIRCGIRVPVYSGIPTPGIPVSSGLIPASIRLAA